MSDYRRWTSEEEQYIRDHWKTQSDAEMATALKRMEGAVRNGRRKKNGIWRITGARYPFLASPRSWSGQYRRSRFGLKDWALAGCWILATM